MYTQRIIGMDIYMQEYNKESSIKRDDNNRN